MEWVEWVLRIIIIFAIFLPSTIYFATKFIKIRKTLKEQMLFFEEKVSNTNIFYMLPEIEQRMSANPLLAKSWREFDASLVKDNNSVRTTVEADLYFNEYVLVDVPLHLEIMRNIPGILTALGIIGTFIGIMTGLHGYQGTTLEAVRTSIQQLLAGVNDAFVNSFIAIFLAMLFTVIEKIGSSMLYSLVNKLQHNINQVFYRSVSDEYLQKMYEEMREQSQALKSFSQDLANSVKVAMQELVRQQNLTMQSANKHLAETLSQTIAGQLAPAMDKIHTVMEDVGRKQSESSEQVIRDIVTQFQSTLKDSASTQLSEMMNVMTGTADMLGSLKGELHNFLQSVQQQSTSQQELFHKHVAAMTAQASDGQEQLRREFSSFVEGIVGTLSKVQKDLSDQSTGSIEAIGQQMTNMLMKTQEQIGELSAKLAELNTTNAEKMTETVKGAVTKINKETELLFAANRDINNRLADRMDKLMSSIEEVTQKTVLTAHDLASQLNLGAKQLGGLFDQVKELTASFNNIIVMSKQVSGEMNITVSKLVASSTDIGTVVRDYQQHRQMLMQQLNAFSEQVKLSEERYDKFRELYDLYNQTSKQVQFTMNQNEKVVKTIEQAIDEGLSKYVKATNQSISDYLSKLDASLATAVKQLGSTISELEVNLTILSSVVEKAVRR